MPAPPPARPAATSVIAMPSATSTAGSAPRPAGAAGRPAGTRAATFTERPKTCQRSRRFPSGAALPEGRVEIGRAAGGERVLQEGYNSGGAGVYKKKKTIIQKNR